MKNVVEKLEKRRAELNISQAEMGKFFEICQSAYNNWINERSLIKTKYFPMIAQVCQTEIEKVIPLSATVKMFVNNVEQEGETLSALQLYEDFTQDLRQENKMLKLENTKQAKTIVALNDEITKLHQDLKDLRDGFALA